MIRIELTRYPQTDAGTFGTFVVNGGEYICTSLELRWRDNMQNNSRIPAGEYGALWSDSARFNQLLPRLLEVPGRSGILIHAGNFAAPHDAGKQADSEGCILLGSHPAIITNKQGKPQIGIANSRRTLEDFRARFRAHSMLITIKEI